MTCTVSSAAAQTHRSPSPAQRDAGNYRKGKVRLHGLTISIENPKGTKRRPEWKPLAHHYGYINRTEGRDGDHVDVFIGPSPKSEIVFVVDQVTEGGRFDEHKVMLSFTNEADAKAGYLANYQPGWRCGPITAMTIDQFKTWLAKGDTTKRVAEQVSRYDKQSSAPASPPAPRAPSPAAVPADPDDTHHVGETMSKNGVTYRLNENYRWERADPEEANQSTPGGEALNPAAAQAARNKFVAGKLDSVHPEIGGLMRAIHESPHYKAGGEFASYDVHQKVAGGMYAELSSKAGQEAYGGQVVDLGQGRVGFASEAGSIVVWPANENGQHQISYTNKTGVVSRAMKQGGSQDGQGQAEVDAPPGGGIVESPVEAEVVDEREPEAPPLPSEVAAKQRGAGGGNPFASPPAKPQQNPSPAPVGGKRPDEQAYDDAVGPAKPKAAHVALRAKAEQSKERMNQALAAFEQATTDGESRKTRLRLRNKFSELRQIYNEHHRQASVAEKEHSAKLKQSGKDTKQRMKEKGIGPFSGKGATPPKAGKPAKEPKAGKPAKQPPAEAPTPLIDQAENNPGKGDVPAPTPESLEIGKLPKEAQLAAGAVQTYLKTSGLAVTPENHKALQHAFRRGWIKDKKELRTVLKRAKQLHGKNSAAADAKGTPLADDHGAVREAIRRKANRERRISWAATVKQKASEWDMTPQEFHETASEIYKAYTDHHDEREAAKAHARKASGLTAKDINKLENDGFDFGSDHPKVKGLDTLGREMAEQFPGLGWESHGDSVGATGGDHDQKVWDLLREGTSKKKPSKTSPEFMQHLEEFLGQGLRGEPMSAEDHKKWLKEDTSMVPFAKVRAGIVRRYGLDKAGHEHAPAGSSKGGQFVSKGDGDAGATISATKGQKSRKSKAKVAINLTRIAKEPGRRPLEGEYSDKALRVIDQCLSGNVENAASVVGAPDDASIEVWDGENDTIEVRIKHDSFRAVRRIGVNKAGQGYIYNEEFFIEKKSQGNGLGTAVFERQVENAREMGISYIKCHAAKENPNPPPPNWNGYYTWARFGYDADLSDDSTFAEQDAEVFAEARRRFNAKTLQDVMSTKDGRDWWKENGQDVYVAKFDLSDESRSMAIFGEYLNERNKRKAN